MFFHVDSEVSDQTGTMLRLIWVISERTGHFVGFAVRLNLNINWAQTDADIKHEKLVHINLHNFIIICQ